MIQPTLEKEVVVGTVNIGKGAIDRETVYYYKTNLDVIQGDTLSFKKVKGWKKHKTNKNENVKVVSVRELTEEDSLLSPFDQISNYTRKGRKKERDDLLSGKNNKAVDNESKPKKKGNEVIHIKSETVKNVEKKLSGQTGAMFKEVKARNKQNLKSLSDKQKNKEVIYADDKVTPFKLQAITTESITDKVSMSIQETIDDLYMQLKPFREALIVVENEKAFVAHKIEIIKANASMGWRLFSTMQQILQKRRLIKHEILRIEEAIKILEGNRQQMVNDTNARMNFLSENRDSWQRNFQIKELV